MEIITWLNDLVNCFAVKLKLFALTSALLLKEDLESLNQEVCDHLGFDASSLPHPFFFVYHLFLTLPSGGKITQLHWTECQDRPGGKTAVEKGKVASGHCSCTCRLPYIWQRQYCGNGQQGLHCAIEHNMHYNNASDVDLDLDWELPQRSQIQVQKFKLWCWGFIEIATCRPALLTQEGELL